MRHTYPSHPTPIHAELTVALQDWFERSARSLPWRATRDPYKVLVSEFMLQQTQVVTVIPYFLRWIQRFPDFHSLAAADEQQVLRAWEGLGYYSRARNLHRAAQAVSRQHQGTLPADTQAIRALPGIGPYTAGAISSFAFDLPEPAIDANVQRVLARLFDIQDEISSTAALSHLDHHARALLSAAAPRHGRINAAIMELGALICTSGTPSCHRCPVNDRCPSRDNAAALPVKRRKPAPQRKDEFALWNLDRHGILLELRAGPRWRGLWTLPQITEPSVSTTPLIVHRFGVTRFQISLHILSSGHPITTKRADRGPGVQRIPLAEIADLPLAAPHRRVINDLLGQLDA